MDINHSVLFSHKKWLKKEKRNHDTGWKINADEVIKLSGIRSGKTKAMFPSYVGSVAG